MTSEIPEDSKIFKKPTVPKTKTGRLLQVLGAVLLTGFALWFLFGVPAYILFGILFGE